MPYLRLPNGSYVETPEGMSDKDAFAKAREKFPEAFEPVATPKKGIGAALGRGAESFISAGQTSLESILDPNKAATEGLRREEALGKKYADQIGLDKLQEAYEKKGIFGAVGEVGRQIPLALAEQAPNIAASIASAKLGAMGGTAVLPGVGTVIGAGLGALTPSALQLFGSNVQRQAAEQEAAGRPVDIGVGKALGATAVQAPLDVAATFIPLGGRIAGKVFGPEVEKLLSRGGTKAAEKLAQESLTKTLAKGTAFGAAVAVPTEITQQMLERYQAGLALTTPDALKEYGETAYQAGLLGPLGAVGRLSDRSAARSTVEAEALEKQKRLAAEQNRLAEETKAKEDAQLKVYYASPEGQAEIQKTQADFTQRIADLEAVRKQKDLSKEDKRNVIDQIKALKQEQAEYAKRVGIAAPEVPGAYKTLEQRIEELKTTREQEAAEAQAKEAERLQQARELQLGEEIPASKFVELPGAKSTLTVAEKEAQAKELEDTRTMLANSIPRMENMLDRIQSQIDEAIEKGDTKAYRDLIETRTQVSDALDAAQKQRETLPKLPEEERASLEKEVSTLKKQAAKYTGSAFDQEKLDKIVGKLEKAQKRLEELPAKEQEDLFAPKQQGLAFEPTKEELAYEARRAELEETFNTQMPQKVAEDLVDSVNNQPKSAENLELNALRIERINRAIEEAKAANDINTVNILNEKLAEAKTSVESLGGSWSELTRKAEGRLDKALMDQQKAVDELRDAIEDLVKSRYLGKGQKETAFAATNKEGLIAKAEQAAGDYIEAAVRDVDARRAAAKQKAMTPDEALKLAYDLKDSLENVINNRNLSVLLRPEYIQQRLSLGQKALREKMPDEERMVLNRIAAQYSKMQKENTLQEGISQIEKQLAGIKQKYIKGESALKVEKQFFSAMERDPVQMLRTEKAKTNPDLNKIRFLEKQIAETEEPVTGVSKVEKTGEYEVVGKKGEIKKVPTYKVTEQAALTPREKELAQFYPEYAKPDEGGVDLAQRELFGERDLEPVATVRATPANFMKFVGIQRQKLQLAKKLAQQAVEKAKVENDKYAKIVKEIEQVKLELETVPLEKAPALYITVPEATKTFEAASKKLEDFTQKQEENAKALEAGVKAPHDLGRGSYQLAQKQALTKAFLEAEKQLNKAQTDKERLPAARIKKFIEDSKAQRNRYIKRHLQLEVKKDKLLEKLGVTGEKRPLTEEQTAALLAQDNRKALIAKLSSDLETSYAQTKKELENRAAAMHELFSKPLEQSLEKESVALTKKEIKFYENRIKWLKKNTKGKSAKAKFVFEKEIPAYEKRLTELNKILDDEQSYIDSIRGREESIVLSDIIRARENSDVFVKRTRKRLKKLLEESEAKGEVDQAFSQATLGKFDEAEAKAAADLDKKIAEKRVSEQKALEKGEAAAYVRQEVKPVVVKEEVAAKGAPEDLGVTTERTVEIGTKSRNLAAVRKLIRNKEAQLEKAKEGTPEYARLERQLGILKEARDRERQPLMQKEVTKKVGLTKTAAEKRQEVIERSREGAAEMAGIRKRLGKTIDEMPKYEADIKAYIKAIETRITANEKALKTKALVGPLRQKFNSLAEKEEVLTDVIKELKDEIAKENVRIAELKEKTKAARTLASLGDQPARKQRKKPLKTGVAEIEEGIKAEKEGEFTSLFEGELEYNPETRFTRTDFDDYNYSRGAPTKGSTVKEVISSLEKAFGKKGILGDQDLENIIKPSQLPKVSVIESIETAPEWIRDLYGKKVPPDAKGFVDGNKAFLITENIGKGEELGVLLHEVGAHIGFKNLFTKTQYNTLANSVKQWGKLTDGSLEAKVGRAARERVDAAKTAEKNIDDELIAYAVEEAVGLGVDPYAMKGGKPIVNWLRAVFDLFKKFLTKLGLKPETLTAGDFVNMAYGAAHLELRGTWHGSPAKFEQFDLAYAGTGELSVDKRFAKDRLGAGPYVTNQKTTAEYHAKIKGTKGHLYRTLDDVPDNKIYQVYGNSIIEGKNPKLDALVRKYGKPYAKEKTPFSYEDIDSNVKYYPGNFLWFDLRKEFGDVKAGEMLQKAGFDAIESVDRSGYHERAFLGGYLPKIFTTDVKPIGAGVTRNQFAKVKDGELLFSRAKFADPNDPLSNAANLIVGREKSVVSKLKGNLVAFNTQFVDRLAPLKEIWRRMGETGPASQMMYNLLAHGQRTNITSETVVNGPRIFYKNPETGEVTIRAGGGPGMKDVLEELLQSKKGNVQALNEGFTAYAIAKRADDVGFNKLVMDGVIDGKEVTPQMLAAAKKSGDADPHFVKAFEIYQKYNNGLIDTLVDSGYLGAQKGKELKAKNYVPYYRIRNGNAELMIGMESPIRIGSLKEQPYLKELVGGETKVRDFFRSSVENTAMITDMALSNNATMSVANTLKGLGIAEIHKGNGPASPDVIRFKSNGKDYHAVIDTSKNAEFNDINPDLLVKGLEGIPTQLPGIVRLLGIPANWLRKGVTRNPFYAYKQLVRDPISAYLTTGGNFVPILSSLKEIGKAARGTSDTSKFMQESGITGGEVYTGYAEDLNQIVTRLKGGSANLTGAMAFMDRVASQADASTRSVLYESFRKQGLTDMEAQIATMESMNFNTRGASPSMHWVNTMVPFFNSAVQGYNVLYKAFTGKMPYAKRLDLQNKLIRRGSMIFGMSILYAIANQDNEAYQNATPEQKYMNWFIPGFGAEGKESFRMPIPFEAGYIFKALPEALVNMAYKDDAAKEGLDAIKVVLNATNPLGVPTAIKAPLEAYGFNKSIYTGRDIESIRLQQYEPGQRYYDTTNEGPKMLGEMLNISPVKLDYLFKNYFGGLYTTASALVNPMLIDSRTVKPDGSLADTPAFGTLFQPRDGGGITRSAYDALEGYVQKAGTLERLQETGREKEAEVYLKKYEKEIGIGQGAGAMKSQLDALSAEIRKIKESVLQPGQNREQFAREKRDQIKELQDNRTKLAKEYLKTIAETKRQSSPAQ